MRNYIILNGNNSNEITGLLIQSLPPISKPLMRTAIEEIDGRDGDIVTNLGYSAYDKEVSIGLYGSYDVDEVIKYFSDNSKGQVTFSNEPDKYYNYEIINQIDFERLIRFKTAIVTLHCQPFKYPVNETPVEIEIQNITNEAEEMDLDNTSDAPMKLDLKGNTQQDGEPTPDSPVDINVVSGDNTIEICGKNIWSSEWEQGAYSASDGISKISSTNYVRTKDKIAVLPNTTYTLSWTSIRVVGNIFYYRNDSSFIKTSGNFSNVSSYTFTTPNNCYYINVNMYNGTAITPSDITNTQLEKGNQATTYEAYTGNSQLISLGNIELNKISTYQDYIYKENDRWFLHKEIGKVVLNGSENNWQGYSVSPNYVFFINDSIYHNGSASDNPILSDKFKPDFSNNDGNIYLGSSHRLAICTSLETSVDNWKTWLSNNNVLVYYALATSTDTEITDTNLINQLNNLANAKSYDPITHITQNANDKPFILNATAVQKGTDTATVDNDGNIYSKPTLDIEGNGIVAIYLNGNQMFSVDLSNSSECIIDVTNLEAYDPETNELMNRQVTGDYSKFILPVGENTVKVSGNVTKTTISDYTRYL